MALAAMPAAAAEPVVLSDAFDQVVTWDATRIHEEQPDRAIDAATARALLPRFKPASGARNNLGAHEGGVWLHVPLNVDIASDGRWILSIDYPPLNEARVHLFQNGKLLRELVLGTVQPYSARPYPSRAHAVALELVPGASYELLVRLQTSTAMIAPIELHKPAAFVAHEGTKLLMQGIFFGLSLTFLGYSLFAWATTRDALFGLYALMSAGSLVFFLSISGLGNRYVWNDQSHGFFAKLAPLMVMVMMSAGANFVRRALDTRLHAPRIDAGLKWSSVAAGGFLVLSLLGGLDYRTTQAMATVLGPMVLMLCLPAAAQRMRAGDPLGTSMLLGWSAFLVGAMVMAGLLRGVLPATPFTLSLFQISTVFEAFAWMNVLALRTHALRVQAAGALAERTAMESLACTDALTGVANRRGLSQALDLAVASRLRKRNPWLAVYMLDLDGFKAVNDGLGHDAGDELLVAAALRLRDLLRGEDVLARLGGDEFVVAAGNFSAEVDAQILGERMLSAFAAPFVAAGHECRVGVTIGYALAPDDGTDPSALLRAADVAMYEGKEAGRNMLRRARPVVEPPTTDTIEILQMRITRV
jgi:diguanylate cyclase